MSSHKRVDIVSDAFAHELVLRQVLFDERLLAFSGRLEVRPCLRVEGPEHVNGVFVTFGCSTKDRTFELQIGQAVLYERIF
jgi:hypothetical protein